MSFRRRLLLVVSTTLLFAALGHTPAKAADLAVDCSVDLEERVAELEATTVRKGNKKVSVTLYGQVNRAVLFWDDGAEKNAYGVDNNYESSRFSIKARPRPAAIGRAGYRLGAEPRKSEFGAAQPVRR